MEDCVFCAILSGDLPASMVYRDERCATFLDIQPVNPGHILIIPNQHAAYLADIDGRDGGPSDAGGPSAGGGAAAERCAL